MLSISSGFWRQFVAVQDNADNNGSVVDIKSIMNWARGINTWFTRLKSNILNTVMVTSGLQERKLVRG
jgi:hypothetical protein